MTETTTAARRFPIVGIGASAGGVEALEAFFAGLPDEPGLAFVVVTHLSAERESVLHEILARYTPLPVTPAVDGVRIAPNTVHVLGAGDVVGITKGRLRVARQDPAQRERKPIDLFFAALAEDQGEYAVGVVLSGGDGDGTLGAKAIKARGGLTLAQVADGTAPIQPSMPASAIAAGLVDIQLPAEAMGTRLAAFARTVGPSGEVTDEGDRADGASSGADAREPTKTIRTEICGVLRSRVGHDFSGYKPKTFLRRVHRRMQVHGLETHDAYIARLREDPSEATALFRDLLINVTAFFRDAESFEALEREVIPDLFEGRSANETVRVWVPGCATGEEVYSIAILMHEVASTRDAAPRVQIFATDIDEHALTVARAGRYPAALLDGVSEARRQRWFDHDGGTYVIAKDIRDMCVFSPHSVIRDPPFSRIDLVSCRNLLIYFGPQIQEQVVPIFHYALRPHGYLFLGLSENVGQFGDLFVPLNKKVRIFRAREEVDTTVHLPTLVGRFLPQEPGSSPRSGTRQIGGAAIRQAVEAIVLSRFSPPHVVVDAGGDVVYASSRTGRFLELSAGPMNRQLVSMARKGLRIELQSALRDAAENGHAVRRENVAVETEDDRLRLTTIVVEPLTVRDEPLFMVLFENTGPAFSRDAALHPTRERTDEAVLHYDRELRETRERLQSMIEEYETAVEELKSSNEELVSVNEEPQSTNEELEASKEELQSLNAELQIVNAELTVKVEELDRANNDLRNLFESTRVATVFLDGALKIRSFTPAISQIFNLRPSDVGRPLTDLASRLDLPEFADHVRSVLETGASIELPARNADADLHYLVRLAAYRDSDHKIAGVVATFLDVTQLTRAQIHQRLLMDELNHRVKNTLATVQAIAGQSFRGNDDTAAERKTFTSRLLALAGAHDVLTVQSWEGADLGEIVQVALDPFRPDRRERIETDGPPARLNPRAAVAIALALHELATNAAKYGALSDDAGRVRVTWTVAERDGETMLRLRWEERDGPPVTPPDRRGFGSRLIEVGLASELHGTAELRYEPEGVVCVFEAPLRPTPPLLPEA